MIDFLPTMIFLFLEILLYLPKTAAVAAEKRRFEKLQLRQRFGCWNPRVFSGHGGWKKTSPLQN
jgi:hypothetical protein